VAKNKQAGRTYNNITTPDEQKNLPTTRVGAIKLIAVRKC
jgi:hypothetical protein